MMASGPANAHRHGYRSDIEGLRAVAILLVVAAHAKVAHLAGGFIGVDVFFVLSGYLITGLLVSEIQATGKIAFAAFYARRLRRLLPALLLMVVCTGVLGAMLLAPGEQPAQATAAASAILWLSNFHFAFSNLGYFSAGAETNLFLHTWSLGVEEQFYLVWPVFLLLALGMWAGSGREYQPRKLKIAMLMAFGLSFIACVAWTPSAPQIAFYMMPTRAWQFALGALVFLYFGAATSPAGSADSGRLSRMLHWSGWIGLVLIIGCAILIDGNVLYPGAWALLPAAGTALVLAAGTRQMKGVSALLSLQPMQAIGRVSYAWYLWHWPILLLGATLVDMASVASRACLVVVSLLLAVLSWYLVETPIRHNPRWIARPSMAVFSALATMIFAGALAIRWHNSAMERLAQPEQMRYLLARSETPAIYRMGCDDWYHSADVRLCSFGPEDAAHTVVAMGDSVGLQWFPAMARVFDRPDWRLLVLTKSSCPMVDEPIFYPRIGREYTECAVWRKNALLEVAALAPDIVILGSSYTYDLTEDEWIEGSSRVLREISPAADHIYVLRSTPVLPFDGPSCLAPRSWLYEVLSDDNRCTAPAFSAHSDEIHRWLEVSTARFTNASVLDMTNFVCPHGQCRAERDGVLVYRDTRHLSVAFAKSLAGVLARRLNLAVETDGVQ